MGQNICRIDSWSSIMDHFWSRLDNWKAKCLSFGGWGTLIKSFMGSLSSYLMSMFLTPITVLNALEAMSARFFWVGGICMIVICIWFGGIESSLREML